MFSDVELLEPHFYIITQLSLLYPSLVSDSNVVSRKRYRPSARAERSLL